MTVEEAKRRFGIIGNSDKLNAAISKALKIAQTDLSVLVTGESGVGKENISKIIHANSSRMHKKLVVVNCGAIPAGTIDSELFGHEKGAFTGAVDMRKGYFETADGGTIFLDEIGDMPIDTQMKLFRVLENGEYIRVGASEARKTNVRVVAATNADLQKFIAQGKFREELYWRLCYTHIKMPALRERKEDIPLLFAKFTSDFSAQYGASPLLLTPEAEAALMDYRWPGNVRELKSFTNQMSALETEKMVTSETVAHYLALYDTAHLPVVVNTKTEVNVEDLKRGLSFCYDSIILLKEELANLKNAVKDMSDKRSSWRPIAPEKNENEEEMKDVGYLEQLPIVTPEAESPMTVYETSSPKKNPKVRKSDVVTTANSNENEAVLIKKCLEKYGDNIKLVAIELQMTEGVLKKKIKKYGL
ncbi:MAG: sigma-54 dependent transcriptional regulator [Bacteroidales bacterium]|nr:sigma-54 dependent transcriptional regulator [Bacteroidales bacterium]